MHTGSTVRLPKGDRAQDDPCARLSSHRARVGGEEKAEADCLGGACGTSARPEVYQTGWIRRWRQVEEVEARSQSVQRNLQHVVVSTGEPVFLEAAHKQRKAKASQRVPREVPGCSVLLPQLP